MQDLSTRSHGCSRQFDAAADDVFAAIRDPQRLARWWGPAGFTNTFHEFEFRPGGRWLLTMHGPDGRDHANENRFTRIEAGRVVEIEHRSAPHFELAITLTPCGAGTRLDWRQTFDTADQYRPIADFIAQANEQNLDRLAAELLRPAGPAGA